MIARQAEPHVLRLSNSYPVVTITGPRQSGKTTLARKAFPDHTYVSLENLDTRSFADRDPNGFLKSLNGNAIIDEIQHVPSLLSYIQTDVDQLRENGRYILTGSQQFELMHQLGQSLAGRTAIVKLLPLSIEELFKHHNAYGSIESYLYTGFYPRLYDQKLNATEAYSFYTSTYLERDIRSLINIKDYLLFDRFLRVCASRTGQILNISSIGNECGISNNTASSWLSLLEASFITYRLPPYHTNFTKRLVKSPKLYFFDVGLASFLIGIQAPEQWNHHPLKGAFFETLVVSEMIKNRFNSIKGNNLFYFRDNIGHEVDVVMDEGLLGVPVEVKLSQTIHEDFFRDLQYYNQLQKRPEGKSALVYGGDKSYREGNIDIVSFKNLSTLV